MNTEIITKFTIATDQGIAALLYLTQTIAREKYADLLSEKDLEQYLDKYCSEKALLIEVNSMSNQWLVVYANNQPAGFARITSKGERPEELTQNRVIRIADFGTLSAYSNPGIRQSLFDKCCSQCKAYEAAWICEYAENPDIAFFESQGFKKTAAMTAFNELPLPAIFLIRLTAAD